MGLGLEFEIGLGDAPPALDEHRLRAVDHDFADFRISQQGLEWAQAEHVVDDQLGQLVLVVFGEPELRLVTVLVDQLGDALVHDVRTVGVRVHPERSDQPLVDGFLDFLDIWNARGNVGRLDGQAGEAGSGRRLAFRLLWKLAFVELVNEQHAILLAVAPRPCIGERSLRRPPGLSADWPDLWPNGGYPAQAAPLAKRAVAPNPSGT